MTEAADISPQESSRILVVDDEEAIRKLLVGLLADRHGYDVTEACDGLEAYQLLSEEDFDVVLTDLSMPRMGGLELMQWAQIHRPGAAWIVLSGHATVDSAIEAVRLGAFDFIRKPLELLDNLTVTVRNALRQQALAAERVSLIDSLAQSNEQLTEQVEHLNKACDLLTAQGETIRQDLYRAELIQRALLPCRPPKMRGFASNSVYRPCRNVAGDLYEVVAADDKHMVMYIADAAGHGVSAAMLAVLFKHRIAALDKKRRPRRPSDVLNSLNQALLAECGAPGLFITAVYCLLNLETGLLEIASAGHPPVLLCSADGARQRLYHTGPALGFSPEAKFAQKEFQLSEGDRLLMYTDGVFDAGDGARPIDCDELEEMLSQRDMPGDELLSGMLDLAAERRMRQQQDDITIVLLTAGDAESTLDNGLPEHDSPSSAPSTPSGPQVLWGVDEDSLYVTIEGQANWTHCAAFHDLCTTKLAEGLNLVLDISLCTQLDSTFLGTIHEVVAAAGKSSLQADIQSPLPDIRGQFEELGMQLVLDRITSKIRPLPGVMSPLGVSVTGGLTDAQRMLDAHKALASLGDHNRDEFLRLIQALQSEVSQMESDGDAEPEPAA
ncbi:MAG: fused response regulator/phosphatase [Phycisphaerae bacterium]|jgi:sigma-B regulation protein RsbU (phosphoserine phosphatase)|nr:fused response regulator/phosphatase [Phycisphaerae bacterium]